MTKMTRSAYFCIVLITVALALSACSDPDTANGQADVGDSDTDTDAQSDVHSPSLDANGTEDAQSSDDTGPAPQDTTTYEDADATTYEDADASDEDAQTGEDTGGDVDTGPEYDTGPGPGAESLTAEEQALFDGLNDLRQEHGLDPVPLSYSLTVVARTHVQDLIDHGSEVLSGECNLHSWSEHGNWTPCCYTPDHAEASCMWSKPGELTNYTGMGYEISAYAQNAQMAVNSWNGSELHRNVIINEGIWDDHNWQALGIGIDGGYAHAWFGTAADPDEF